MLASKWPGFYAGHQLNWELLCGHFVLSEVDQTGYDDIASSPEPELFE